MRKFTDQESGIQNPSAISAKKSSKIKPQKSLKDFENFMQKIVIENTKVLRTGAVSLFILFALGQTAIFAGNQPTGTVESTGSIKTLRPAGTEERQLAAAQMRHENRPPNGNANLRGGESAARTQFSFFYR